MDVQIVWCLKWLNTSKTIKGIGQPFQRILLQITYLPQLNGLIMSTSCFQSLSQQVRQAVIIMNHVDNLQANPFQSLSYEEKLQIKCICAHWPLDINITQQVGNHKFNNERFGRNQRPTANLPKQSLFCFPCYSVERVCGPSLGLRVSFSSLKG